MKNNPRCSLCLGIDREVCIGSPIQYKRRAYICSECVEVCTFVLLEKKYEMLGKQERSHEENM